MSWDILESIDQSSTNSCFIFNLSPKHAHLIKNICILYIGMGIYKVCLLSCVKICI